MRSPSGRTAPNRCSSDDHDGPDRGHPPAGRAAAPSADRTATHRPGLGLSSRPPSEQPLAQSISAVLITPPQAPADTQWTPPTAVIAAGAAAQHHQPRAMGCRRVACVAETGRTTTASAPRSCTTPPGATTTRRRTPRRSSGRSTRTTPRHWAGATSPTTRWSTSTARCSRAGPAASTGPVKVIHTGGFNRDTWGVAMIGDFDDVPPTPIQLRTVGRLIGWRLGLDHVDPQGTVALTSAGGRTRNFPPAPSRRCRPSSRHRDVGTTDCPGNAAYALLDEIRDIAAHFNDPPGPQDLADGAAGRRDLRPMAGDGRARAARWVRRPRRRRPGRARRATPPSTRARCTGRRRPAPNPSPGRSTTPGRRSAIERGALGLADQRRDPGAAVGRCRTSSTAR